MHLFKKFCLHSSIFSIVSWSEFTERTWSTAFVDRVHFKNIRCAGTSSLTNENLHRIPEIKNQCYWSWVLVCFLFLLVFFFMVWLMTLALRETLHLPRSSWARLLAFYSYWNIWPHNALHCHNRTRLEAYLQKTFGTFWSFRLFLQESRSREEDGVKNNLACVHAYLDLALV